MTRVIHPDYEAILGHSQAEKAKSRERILQAAAQQIREHGVEGVSIAELMKAADLTHGGFYGHFPSRSALIVAAIEHAIEQSVERFGAAKSKHSNVYKVVLNRYLSGAHRDDVAGGCAFSALAGDIGRTEDDDVREIMQEKFEQSFAWMAESLGDGAEARDAALASWSAMIGAVMLSRIFAGTARSDQILRATRKMLLDQNEDMNP